MQVTIDLYAMLLLLAVAAVSAVYCVDFWRKKMPSSVVPMLLSVAAIYFIVYFLGYAGTGQFYSQLAFGISIAALAAMLATFYITRPVLFLFLTVLLIGAAALYVITYQGSMLFAGMFGVGTMFGLTYRSIKNRSGGLKLVKKRKSTEINRDLIHILLGVIIVAVMFSAKFATATDIVFGLILLGYIVNNVLSTERFSAFYKKVLPLERHNVIYGVGAMHLAAGAAIIIGFISNFNFVMFGIIALFFADPIATIVGLSLSKIKIPFNKDKTVAGSIAFFAVAAVLGYPFIGIYSISFGIILAIVESLNIFVDDNIRVGIVTVLLYMLVYL